MASQVKVRGGLRSQVTKELKRVDGMLQGTVAAEETVLRRAKTLVEGYLARIADLDQAIVESYLEQGEEGKADQDSDQSAASAENFLKQLTKLNDKISEIQGAIAFPSNSQVSTSVGGGMAVASGNPPQPSGAHFHRKVKLPKLGLRHFSGNYLEYQTFRDLFKVSIDDDPALSDVEKFSYLLDCLEGDALAMVEGYDLTDACYKLAFQSLDERYGDPQRAKFGHFQSMLAITPASDKLSDVQRVADQCEMHIRCLVALGIQEDMFSVVLAPILLSKLPREVTRELHRRNDGEEWKLGNIRKWLKSELRARELTQSLYTHANENTDRKKTFGNAGGQGYKSFEHKGGSASTMIAPGSGSATKQRNVWNKGTRGNCGYCNGDHFSDQCKKFATAYARRNVLRVGYRCYRCLERGHTAPHCRADDVCPYCSGRDHHRSLCLRKFGTPIFTKGTDDRKPRKNDNQLNVDALVFVPSNRESVAVASDAQEFNVSFLPTAVTTLLNESTEAEREGRVLLDTASSRSFITEDMCQRLGLKVVGQSYISVGRFGSSRRTTSASRRVQVGVRCLDGSVVSVTASVTQVISSPVSRFPIDRSRYPVVNQLRLAEPLSDRPDSLPLDLLIGTDFYYQLVCPESVITCKDGPTFIGSKLGFLTAGTMPVSEEIGADNTLTILLLTESAPGHSDPYDTVDLERFWKLEEAGVGTKLASKDISDEEALANFYATLKFEKGRYWVKWPWRSESPELADNSKLAYARFRSTFMRLKKTPEILKAYDDVIRNQLDLDVVEVAPEKPSGPLYYLPHREVITPSKVTTKLRVVYDASSKSGKDSLSLNDCMHRGIVVLEDLCGLLMRFRTWRIGIVADIEKAFLQIGLQDTERDVARFYWVRDITRPLTHGNVVVYRFKRVFFGAIGSPSLLGSTLDAHARSVESSAENSATREIAKAFRENVYSDNHVGGEDDEEKAVTHYQESKKLCRGASMNLREFYTNSDTLKSKIASEDVGKSKETKVLGVVWTLEDDHFRCSELKGTLTTAAQVTKRDVVREVARVFDPCGWFSPVVMPAKLLIQHLWKQEIGWDEELPQDLVMQWTKLKESLLAISSVEIPRYVGSVRQAHQIHAFCDASLKAAAVAVYLRTEIDGRMVCSLLISKTRVAPLNPQQTIPTLELIGVELGVRLVEFVCDHMRGTDVQKFVWSDSQCVLAWLKNEKLTTRFVQKRIEAIRAVEGVNFRFVSGLENPADIPSRGCTLDSLAGNRVWWHGPDWLAKDESEWPANVLKHKEVLKKGPVIADEVALVVDSGPDPPVELSRYSSLNEALRVVAYVHRAVRNFKVDRMQRNVGTIGLEDLSKARLTCEKWIQQQSFGDFDKWSTSKKSMPESVRSLNVYRDRDGLLRCKGRLQNSDLPFDAQNPILLPKAGAFTDLVVAHAHGQVAHAGTAQTLAAVRERYWIVSGKSVVKRVLHECRRCRRTEGGPYKIPDFPPLPEFRVVENYPFAYTGLDYLGPLTVKVGKTAAETVKVWMALFTCALTRAVHMEVVGNQSAQEFQLALRRFFAAFGSPLVIVSDNASQFRTVENALKRLGPTETSQETVVKFNVEWKYIPEVAPWMGGFYERMIGVVKRFLKKVLDGVVVNASELRTVVAEIEYVVNSRPLLTVDAEHSFYSLCPNDFLGKPRKSCFPSYDETQKSVSLHNTVGQVVETWKMLQRLSTRFWEMWRQSYLTSLREKQSNARQRNTSSLLPTVGSVVQVKEEKMPRARWLLGKIEKLITSNDGKVRSVVLRLANGRSLVRPIKLLYPLEMGVRDPTQNEDNDFQGFSQSDVDNLQNLLRHLPDTPAPAGGAPSRV